MLGYGMTDKPRAADEYSTKKLCADLAAILDVVGVSKAIVIGHDWGSYIAGRFALWHPDRLVALGIFSVPFTPPVKQYRSLEAIVEKTPNYTYQLYFADPKSTEEIEANLEPFLRFVFGVDVVHIDAVLNMREAVVSDGLTREPRSSPLLTNEELQYVVSQLRDMHGPLSYYRTTKIRFEEEQAAGLADRRLPVALPVLHIWGSRDPTATPERLSWMREMIPEFEEINLPDTGHWIMVEARDVVTEAVMRWLNKLKPKAGL
ncbi:Alpha/Beta hydrolase protein [Russula earlei]|uniref:Alpha/Beta hydrolase protein n=1 Tax=Russula earlei TaxID=71964 RepID=A0ACC0UC07_9AGAM|nr:Alpha/Beta hydrolase protein [Russula earlei]